MVYTTDSWGKETSGMYTYLRLLRISQIKRVTNEEILNPMGKDQKSSNIGQSPVVQLYPCKENDVIVRGSLLLIKDFPFQFQGMPSSHAMRRNHLQPEIEKGNYQWPSMQKVKIFDHIMRHEKHRMLLMLIQKRKEEKGNELISLRTWRLVDTTHHFSSELRHMTSELLL